MSLEIERKFLVKGDFKPEVTSFTRIMQGYICSTPVKSVRVRLCGSKGFLTIKGASQDGGLSRYEFEKEISTSDAGELIKLCDSGLVIKTRYYIPQGNHTWEVDVFEGDNDGLKVAEIELKSPDDIFEKPEWLGEEVTGDKRYINAMLAQHPYKEWAK